MLRLRPTPLVLTLVAFLAGACGDAPVGDFGSSPPPDACAYTDEPIPEPAIHTPRWAFEPWISKDISTADDTRDFVGGFQSRDIPVGVVVLDSPWETQYNTFVPSPSRYPGFPELVSELGAGGVRVVLWVTQMVNTTSFDFEDGGDSYVGASPNFDEGLECGFFVNEGQTFGWWKGVGAAVDFFDPRAAAWWHRQQDPLLEMGVAGFKLDFGDSYVRSDFIDTAKGKVLHQDYSEAYYRDFYAYGVSKRGPDEFVTMVRPWDESYDFEGRFFARKEHAPVGWVGDNRRDWVGLADALDHIFRSAGAGYVVLGSDIGGYLDRDDKTLEPVAFDFDVLARWTAMGALMPFMELHGRANLAPWTVPESPDEMVALWRYWATLHHELVPFFYSLAEEAYASGGPILHPEGEPAAWPGDYRYRLGEAFLVAPILDGTGQRAVALPSGARWLDWWDPAGDPIDGGQTVVADAADRSRIPLFVREGAIVPLAVEGDATGLGTAASAGHLTVLAYPGPAPTSFVVHDDDGATTTLEAERDANGARFRASRAPAPLLVRVRSEVAATAVTLDGAALPELADRAALDAADEGWLADPVTRSTWVKIGPEAAAREIVVTP